MATVFIPAELRPRTNGQQTVSVEAATVRQALAAVEEQFPGFSAGILEGARLKPGLMVIVDGSIAALGLRQPIRADSEVHVTPALGGG